MIIIDPTDEKEGGMDTNAIDSFIALYETRNMHKAADRLFITQQGLSRVIRNLETEWETVLFERSSGGMIPTRAGDYFYGEALRLRNHLSEIRRQIDRINSGKTEIRLACAYGSLHLLYPLLRQFEDRCAQYRVHWEELPDKEADSRVNSGEADLGLCIYQEQARNVDFTPLIRKRMMLLVYEGHRLWDRDAVEFRDLEGEAIIIEGSDFHIYPQFQQLCLEEGFYPHIIARTAEISFCQHLCRIRAGVSVTVDFITEQSNLEGLRAIPFADGRFSWTVGIGKSLGGTLSPGARELEAFLLENCR